MRASQVIYDRENSSIANAEISDFDFDEIFQDAVWFHTTGITPALSDKAAALTEAALKAARSKGIIMGIDLNYRKKLWINEKAKEVMTRLCEHVDVCIGNEETLKQLLDSKVKVQMSQKVN